MGPFTAANADTDMVATYQVLHKSRFGKKADKELVNERSVKREAGERNREIVQDWHTMRLLGSAVAPIAI